MKVTNLNRQNILTEEWSIFQFLSPDNLDIFVSKKENVHAWKVVQCDRKYIKPEETSWVLETFAIK